MTTDYNFRKVFAAACLGMFLFGMVLMSLGSVLPVLISNFNLTETDAGLLASIIPIGLLVSSIVFGPIVDRYSYRILLIASTIIVLLGVEGLAFANSFEVLVAAFFLIGLGGGALNGAANALVADISLVNANKRGANLSFLGIFFGVGALGMPSLMGFLQSIFSYREIVASLGLIIFFAIVVFAFVHFPKPKQSQGIPIKEGLKLLKDPPLILLGFFLFFQSGFEGIINNWSTVFLEKVIGLTPTRALFALSTYVLFLTLTRGALSQLLQRIPPYRIMAVSLTLLALGLATTFFHESPGLPLVGLAIMGIGVAACFPVILGYVSTLYANLSGTAFSLILTISLIGNVLINYLMGIFSQAYGLEAYAPILAVSLFFMALMLFLALRQIKKRIEI